MNIVVHRIIRGFFGIYVFCVTTSPRCSATTPPHQRQHKSSATQAMALACTVRQDCRNSCAHAHLVPELSHWIWKVPWIKKAQLNIEDFLFVLFSRSRASSRVFQKKNSELFVMFGAP